MGNIFGNRGIFGNGYGSNGGFVYTNNNDSKIIRTGADVFNGVRLLGGIFQGVGQATDAGAQASGAIRGVKHTSNGALNERAGYEYATGTYANNARNAYEQSGGNGQGNGMSRREAKAANKREDYANQLNALEHDNIDDNLQIKEINKLRKRIDNANEDLGIAQGNYGVNGAGNNGVAGQGAQQQQIPGKNAAEQFFFAMQAANQAAPGSKERLAAMGAALGALENTRDANGQLHLPTGNVSLGKGVNIFFDANDSKRSPRDLMLETSQYLDKSGFPSQVSAAEVDQVIAAKNQAQTQGQGAPAPTIGATTTTPATDVQPTTTVADTTTPATTTAAKATGALGLPEPDGQAKFCFPLGTKNVAHPGDVPGIATSQVQYVQGLLGLTGKEADGKWGFKTQARFEQVAKAAGLTAEEIKGFDFNNAETGAYAKLAANLSGNATSQLATKEAPEVNMVTGQPVTQNTAPATPTVALDSKELHNFAVAAVKEPLLKLNAETLLKDEAKYNTLDATQQAAYNAKLVTAVENAPALAKVELTRDGKLDAKELGGISEQVANPVYAAMLSPEIQNSLKALQTAMKTSGVSGGNTVGAANAQVTANAAKPDAGKSI